MYIHDFDTLFNAILISGFLTGAVLFMRGIFHMEGPTIFTVISLFILANYLTNVYVYGLN